MNLNTASRDLAQRLGHDFSDPALLTQALTHASLTNLQNADNQRLEFLGDRILGLVIAEALYIDDTSASEGKLAPRLNALVRKETCGEVAIQLGVGDALRMGRSEMQSGGRRKMALLGDAMEAIIAAIYLDSNFETTRSAILRFWGERISKAESQAFDPKSALQEWAQARGLKPPKYTEISRVGPDHNPIFVVEAAISTGQAAQGESTSKKSAQVLAAQALFDILESTV
ncbi:MAG: ribonuclease III [Rhodobacteraceae bacterium]|nr:ribonuclease III [Paracoccaceae bacterium]